MRTGPVHQIWRVMWGRIVYPQSSGLLDSIKVVTSGFPWTPKLGTMCLWSQLVSGSPGSQKNVYISRKAYPVLIHGVPTSFDMPHSSKELHKHLLDYNSDSITCPSALGTKFLNGNQGGVSQKTHGLLILYLADPKITNACIDCHIVFQGGLLPAV